MTCHVSPELGAFVLHALETPEERAVQQHLIECDECLAEVGELAFTASLLATLRLEDVEPLDEPGRSSGLPRPAGTGHRLRRRALLAVAATMLVGAGAAPAVHLLGNHHQPPQAVVLRGTRPSSGARAEVNMRARDGGTALHLVLTGAPKHGWCSLVARAADGRREIAATWPAVGSGRVDVSGTTAIPVDQVRQISVVTDSARLISIPVPPTNS
jgi:hypothetical protein